MMDQYMIVYHRITVSVMFILQELRPIHFIPHKATDDPR